MRNARGGDDAPGYAPSGTEQDEHVPIDVRETAGLLWGARWLILGLSFLAGGAAVGYLLTLPNIYRASAVVKPDVQEKERGVLALGALSNLGISLGGPSRSEDLEILFRSTDLAIRVFRKYDLWPYILRDEYDPKTRTRKPGWVRRTFPVGKESSPLGDWDAIREVKRSLRVTLDKKSGALTLSYDTPSSEGSARIVQAFLEEARDRLQEEALTKAGRNKEFLQAQIGRSFDPLSKDRLYALYGQEVEREMLARNREQFGFIVIDSPKAPDRKIGPKRFVISAVAAAVGFLVACLYVGYAGGRVDPRAS